MGKAKANEIDEVQLLFSRIVRSMRRYPARKTFSHNTTLAQLKVLWFLESEGSSTMGEVAEMLSVTPPTATSIVNRLVSRGLIRRERDNNDRRVVKLRLLSKGSAALAARRKQFRERTASMLQSLSGIERHRFVAALRVVSETIQNSSNRRKERRYHLK